MTDSETRDGEPGATVQRRHGPVDRRLGEEAPGHPRYEPRGIAGRGGQGIVHRVFDRELRREVALKTIPAARTSPEAVERFLREARATAVLEHPNIVPIHDVGRLDDGRPFYTMRLVAGRSLLDVLRELRSLESGGRADSRWTLVRLVQVIQQACLALQFAHERGVVHRDVKPANLLLGEFGEVLVVDWGISRVAEAEQTTGGVIGTPHYMAPEQVRGERVDARADVHALGVLLYECLTLRLPYEGRTEADLLAAILRDLPEPPERRTSREVPPDLSALALAAIAKSREDRPASARLLHDGLQAHVEGLRDRERQLGEAERFRAQGDHWMGRHEALEAERRDLEAAVASLQHAHPTWEPIASKHDLLEARRALQQAKDASLASFLEAVKHYSDALAHMPSHAPSRRALADVFWARFQEAEERGDRPMAQVSRALVERFHDGSRTRELEGTGSVSLRVEPPGASWALHALVERDLVLHDGPVVATGRGSVELASLEMGSYVLVARADGHESARYPIGIRRNTAWEGELRLLRKGALPDGFLYVPGTWTWLGGDAGAQGSWPLRRVWIDSFLIQRFPVTFGEWCRWLDALPPSDADDRVPRTDAMGRLCSLVEGRWTPAPLQKAFDDDVGARAPRAETLPAFGVTCADAAAYAASLGSGATLPTAEQWELAARGVDRRTYPWGDAFDASLCSCRESVEGSPDPEPVGTRPFDVSVYGVRDLAGGVHDLTCTPFGGDGRYVEVRGGAWLGSSALCRSAMRQSIARDGRATHVGFRPVRYPGSRPNW